MFDCYPVSHCNQRALLNIVNENFLEYRRNIACFVFLQKLVRGDIFCPALLNNINFCVPRLLCRNPSTFYYQIPNSYHHFNSPLITCFRLYNNCTLDDSIDIFHANFNKASFKKKLLARYAQ